MSEIPRVTTLIADMGLMGDSAFYKPKHRRRGRYVHHWSHVIAQGGEVDAEWLQRSSGAEEADDKVEHAEVLPYIEGVRNALSENDISVSKVELEVENDILKYMGHLDWEGTVRGQPAIIDLKCGAQAEWHRIQTAYYGLALNRVDYKMTRKTTLRQRWALYLGPIWGTKSYKLVPHDQPHDYEAAKILVAAWWERQRYGAAA